MAESSQPGPSVQQYGVYRPIYGDPEFMAAQELPRVPDRPARVQVEQKRKLQQAEHIGEYNIWYGKYAGENGYERAARASTRVCLETDAGLTRADHTNPGACICLHFARGCCVYGKDCCYRHCAPTDADETQTDAPHDCFGRDRHATFRDDMGGTGTWNRDCKTLYIGRVCATPSEDEMTQTVIRHLGEFGVLESARVLKSKGCAFVTYTLRCSAEFAKEAMAEQSLDHDEQINVRWAYDDPNPRAKAVRLRNDAQMLLAAMEARGELEPLPEYPSELPPEPSDAPSDEPPPKRAQLGGGDFTPMTREAAELERAEAAAASEAFQAALEADEARLAEEHAQRTLRETAQAHVSRLEQILRRVESNGADAGGCGGCGGGQSGGTCPAEAGSSDELSAFLQSIREHDAAAETAGGGGQVAENGSSEHLSADADLPPGVFWERLPDGWVAHVDPASGHTYYHNLATNQVTWARPTS